MVLHLGDIAPDFVADSTEGNLTLHSYLGNSWGMLFSHPRDFTPVCTTELGTLAKLKPEFDARNTKILALSVDDLSDHKRWIQDINETQACTVNYPLLADPDYIIATMYDMIHPSASSTNTVRAVIIIGPRKDVKMILTYPYCVGRNFNEILRALDALQLAEKDSIVTPANWQVGQDVILSPVVSDEDAHQKYPTLRIVNPYLRYVPMPKGKK